MADEAGVELALGEEREFILSLGGYALQVSGATLVTHERVPVPAFNFVQDVRAGAERQAAFFERALDHYFQRALRPTVRVPRPPAPHLDSGLRRFGFLPRAEPWSLILHDRGPLGDRTPGRGVQVRRAELDELSTLVPFWVGAREADEFYRGLEVAWSHPNPHERLVPLIARAEDRPIAAALLFQTGTAMGIHAVATQPGDRGQGAATALVSHALLHETPKAITTVSIGSDSARLDRRLESLGFHVAKRWTVYELPGDAQLTMPDPGPPQPPRWRPPRKPG